MATEEALGLNSSQSNGKMSSSNKDLILKLDTFQLRAYSCVSLENDLCLLAHGSGICVLCLAKTHPLIDDNITIDRVDFQVCYHFVVVLQNSLCID
jgi:hypothetical protein